MTPGQLIVRLVDVLARPVSILICTGIFARVMKRKDDE